MTVAEDIQARLLTVDDLFDDAETSYTVPIYQRNYTWGTEQIEQLIDDIRDAKRENSEEYFLGNLIVMENLKLPNDFEIVDGQQRLTTLHMLLTHLAATTGGQSAPPRSRLRYQSRAKATAALRRILAPSLTAEPGTTEDSAIKGGYNTIKRHLETVMSRPEDRIEFADYLRSRVRVVRASLPPGTDLNRYFEIMNSRGQQLQQVDIVKARLMSDLETEEDRACFAWIWDACSDMESYLQMAIARGSVELRAQLFGEAWAWPQPASFDELLTLYHQHPGGSQAGAIGAGSEPMRIADALDQYATVAAPVEEDDEANVRFRSPIEFSSFLLHVLKIFTSQDTAENEGQLDDKVLIDRFEKEFPRGDRSATIQRVREFAHTLFRTKFIFDNYVLKRERTTDNVQDGEWSLRRVRKNRTRASPTYINSFAIRDEDTGENTDDQTQTVLLLQSMLRVTYTAPRTMHWITLLLRSLSAASSPDEVRYDHILTELHAYARGKVREAFFTGDEPTGFSIQRIVFTYIDYLLVTRCPKKDFRFSFRNSIEHFYPQYPDPERPFDHMLEDEDPALHLLGNLALVSVSANSKFSNHPPRYKAEFPEIISQSPKLGLMAEAASSPRIWDKNAIFRHHEEMVTMLRTDLATT